MKIFNKGEGQYLGLLAHVLGAGTLKEDRTGTGTSSIFGSQLRFNLKEGFPLLTTKKVHFKSIAVELLWFLRGETNTKYLNDNRVTIWDEWALPEGHLGPIYGFQWRSWPKYDGDKADQIADVIKTLKSDPDSRRILVSAWNVGDLEYMQLPPCHLFFQAYSKPLGNGKRELSLQVYQRSADVFLGVPFNIASYALLALFLAQVTGHEPGELIWVGGDTHVYSNHFTQAHEQLDRGPRTAPTVRLSSEALAFIDQYNDEESQWYNDLDHLIKALWWKDFILEGYDPHPAIKAPVAV